MLDFGVHLVLVAFGNGVPVGPARLLPCGQGATRTRAATPGIPTGPGIRASAAALGRGAPAPVRVRAAASLEVRWPVRCGRGFRIRHPEGEQEITSGSHRGQYKRGGLACVD